MVSLRPFAMYELYTYLPNDGRVDSDDNAGMNVPIDIDGQWPGQTIYKIDLFYELKMLDRTVGKYVQHPSHLIFSLLIIVYQLWTLTFS